MLGLIAKALSEFNEHGITVIMPTEVSGLESKEVADYVLLVLDGLKCSTTHYHDPINNTYTIEDDSQ